MIKGPFLLINLRFLREDDQFGVNIHISQDLESVFRIGCFTKRVSDEKNWLKVFGGRFEGIQKEFLF